MKLTKKIFLFCVTAASLASCKADLMDLAPYDAIASGNMWQSENLSDMGVIGVYNILRAYHVAYDLNRFDSYGITTDCRDPQSITMGNITSGDGTFSGYWINHYEGISRANDAIAHLPEAPLDENKSARLIAETKFLRAYFYYKLNMMYKGVPIYLEPTELEELVKGRSTETEVWETVIKDLTDAINTPQLPDKYKSGDADYGRDRKSVV